MGDGVCGWWVTNGYVSCLEPLLIRVFSELVRRLVRFHSSIYFAFFVIICSIRHTLRFNTRRRVRQYLKTNNLERSIFRSLPPSTPAPPNALLLVYILKTIHRFVIGLLRSQSKDARHTVHDLHCAPSDILASSVHIISQTLRHPSALRSLPPNT